MKVNVKETTKTIKIITKEIYLTESEIEIYYELFINELEDRCNSKSISKWDVEDAYLTGKDSLTGKCEALTNYEHHFNLNYYVELYEDELECMTKDDEEYERYFVLTNLLKQIEKAHHHCTEVKYLLENTK